MIFAKGLSSPEGPLGLADGSWLVVEMGSERGCVSRISPDGSQIERLVKTGRPNGLALDRQGAVWVAESLNRQLLRLDLPDKTEVWLEACGGQPFLWPNDLCFGPGGLLYMTDSGVHVGEFEPTEQNAGDEPVELDGRVYQIDVRSRRIVQIDGGLSFANGIAVDAAGNLFVSESMTGNIYRYELQDRRAGPRRFFGNVIDPDAPPGWKGPDGMKFGLDGNLYVTVPGQGDVTVLGQDGQVLQRIRLQGKNPTNLAFDPAGMQKIYVTEMELGQVEVHEVGTAGLSLYT
jgi:gluconolactonase